MKTAFPDIVGNEKLKNRLRDEICNGTLAHAYLIEGAPGTAKHTLSLRIAAALACENRTRDGLPLPCGVCPSCKKILSGNSPDVIRIDRKDKMTIGVEAIREMHNSVYVAPNETDTKVYVLEDAHLMTVQAQNAFLLTLEEPPAYVLFLLLCESVEPLLETVRSRAPTLRMESLSAETTEKALSERFPKAVALRRENPDEYRELIVAASGSLGTAIAMLDPKVRQPILDRRNCAKKFVRLCEKHRDSSSVLQFLAELGQKREEICEQFDVILLCLRDLILCKQSDHAPLCFYADREEALNEACKFSSPELFRICSCLNEASQKLTGNANVRLTLTSLAVRAGLLS